MPAATAALSTHNRAEASALSRLPQSAQQKFEHLRRIELRARSTINGLRDELLRIRETRQDAERELAKFDEQHAGKYVIEEDEKTGLRKRLPFTNPDRNNLVATIAACRAEHTRLLAEQEAAPIISTANILAWLKDQGDTQFVAAHTPNKIGRIEVLAVALEKNRDAQAQVQDQLVAIESEPLTAADAKAAMRAEIEAMAESGQPNISPLFAGQPIVWATRQFLTHTLGGDHPHGVSTSIRDASALTVWINRELIINKLDQLIDAEATTSGALSREERARELAERSANLLLLQRQEEAIIERLEAQGQVIRRQCTDPLVLLGIER